MIREIYRPDGLGPGWPVRFLITLADPVRRMFSDYYFLDDSLKVTEEKINQFLFSTTNITVECTCANVQPVRPGHGRASQKSSEEFHMRCLKQVRLKCSALSTFG